MEPLAKAHRVRGVVEAARLRRRYAEELADPDSSVDAGELGDAIDQLEESFPDLKNVPIGQEDDFAAGIHAGRSRQRRHTFVKERRPNTERRTPAAEKPKPAPPTRKQRARAQASRAAGGADRALGSGARRTRSVSSRAWRDTGVPAAARSTSQFVLQVFGWGLGLSLLYLLLTNAEKAGRGRAAIELLSGGAVGFVRGFVSPLVDPLNPPRKAPAARPLTRAEKSAVATGAELADRPAVVVTHAGTRQVGQVIANPLLAGAGAIAELENKLLTTTGRSR